MQTQLRQAVVVAFGRTPYCKARKGSFAQLHPVEYGAQTLLGVLARVPQLRPEDIGDVIMGCAMPFGVQGGNMARLIVQRAGLPDCVTAQTVNRYCSSGLQTIATAANAIRCGEEDVVIAGGVESMSLVPMLVGAEDADPWLAEHRPEVYTTMGITAENVARQWGISRADMDAMAVESHRRAAQAQAGGCFDGQIIPITVPGPDGGEVVVCRDEGIRPGTTAETLAGLKPCFLENGSVTAATSSQMTDGAGFVVLMSEEKAAELGVKPLARFVSFATGGVPAEVMGVGPIEAVPKALRKAGLTLEQMDTIELNEAFASQALAVIRTLGMDPARVNPWGGAMALGHPLGATGAMLTCKALSYLERTGGRYGMVTMCIGGGSIINIGSVGGLYPDLSRTAYGVSKAAIHFLTKDIAVQYARQGVRCNAVLPGFTATDAALNNMSQAFLDLFLKNVPLNRPGRPEDIADAVAFLASDRAAFITGEILPVAGGFGLPTPLYGSYMSAGAKG